jgi:hypothetical protein
MFYALWLKYCVFVFVAVVGVLQAAAARNGLRGLQFFRRTSHTYIFAGLAIIVPLGMFFSWNRLYAVGYIAGSQQAGMFFFSAAAAIVFTLLASSLANLKAFPGRPTRLTGLDVYKETTFFRIFLERIRRKH